MSQRKLQRLANRFVIAWVKTTSVESLARKISRPTARVLHLAHRMRKLGVMLPYRPIEETPEKPKSVAFSVN